MTDEPKRGQPRKIHDLARILVRVERAELEQLDRIAARLGVSRNDAIRRLIRRGVAGPRE